MDKKTVVINYLIDQIARIDYRIGQLKEFKHGLEMALEKVRDWREEL